MILAPADLRRMERLHVRAWPAFETASVDGWLWRYSGGGSQRANSVSTIDFDGSDPIATLNEIERRYHEKGAPARVHTFDAGAPTGLDTILAARGYTAGETTVTMFKRVQPVVPPDGVKQSEVADDDWRAVYLGAITENRRQVNAQILEAIPAPRAFFSYRRGGRVISTALSVVGYGCAVVECVATCRDARRQGGAAAVLRALEDWACRQGADLLGLQVVATNHPALALYEGLGFAVGTSNRFWIRARQGAIKAPCEMSD
jgi:GNAT superfamily N-acetyltransferase